MSADVKHAFLLLMLLAAVGAGGEGMHVPMSLGAGTGGDGAWTVGHAAHSPSTVAVAPLAGPAETPAAVLEFSFMAGKYNWSWANVALGTVDPADALAVRVTYRTEAVPGSTRLNLMIREVKGSAYWVPRGLPLSPGTFTTATVSLTELSMPAWSRKDPSGRLEADQIHQVSIGLETGSSGTGRIIIAEVQLVPKGW